MGWFRSNAISLDKDLMERVTQHAVRAGYASPREFVIHAIEKALAAHDDSAPDEEITRRLKGLGYLS